MYGSTPSLPEWKAHMPRQWAGARCCARGASLQTRDGPGAPGGRVQFARFVRPVGPLLISYVLSKAPYRKRT